MSNETAPSADFQNGVASAMAIATERLQILREEVRIAAMGRYVRNALLKSIDNGIASFSAYKDQP